MTKILGLLISILSVELSLGIIVETPDGKIEGLTDNTINGIQYHSFLAIRYAEPPVGALRLQAPQPVKPWDGIYDGTQEKNICYQVYDNNAKENEDCLFLNIFTPKDLSSSTIDADLNVMVWIHGGGFVSGAGYLVEGGFGPKFFMDKNVVLVAINYRLGAFGFMTSGDEVMPGNLGLKDQNMALKWIQKNIASFGGDPTKVTIFGQSAGSASVSYQVLSQQSQGLFRAAIMESGSALSPWAYQRDEISISLKVAQLIDPNFSSTDSRDLLNFFQSVPASAIDNAAYDFAIATDIAANHQISKGFFFAPVIEVPHEGAFITENMYTLYEQGLYNNIPVFLGMTTEESLSLLDGGFDLYYLWHSYDLEPEILVPFDLHVTDTNMKKIIGSEILQYFAGNEGFQNDTAKGIRFHSVHDFDKANIKQAELMSYHTPVWFYQFSYSGPMSNMYYRVPGAGNVCHAEELNYMFSKWYSPEIPDNTDMSYFSEADQNVHYRIMSLWTNFAKYLDPTPSGVDEEILQHIIWQPVEPGQFRYLDIGEDLQMVTGYPKSDSYNYWQSIYDRYAVKPLDTY